MTGVEQAGTLNTISGGVQLGPVLLGHDIQATFHLPAEPQAALAQLPAPIAGFTGREGDVAMLAGLLDPAGAEGAAQVSVVAGLAGVGKTTLAIHTAYIARGRGWYPGGVLFADLHGYDETPVPPGQVLDALLRALRVPAEHIPPAAEERAGLYRSVLARVSEPVLVIADNASSEAQVRLLLPGAGPHRLLVTSRHTLGGLRARLVDLTVLDEISALALLDSALRGARPADDRVSGDPDAARRLAAICAGLPLALQITASILVTDPALHAGELADELSVERARLERLSYDDGSGMAAPSVAAAFELSYRKLADAPARLFRLLPVGPGPDVSTASAAALMDMPVPQVRALLSDLARAHLVDAAAGATGRWLMHDLVRLFARRYSDEQADADGREQALDRLLGYYLDTAGAAREHFRALPGTVTLGGFTDRDDALAWLDAEQPSLTAAVTLAARTGRDQIAARLPACLAEYLGWRLRFDDSLTTMTISRDAARRLGDRASEADALRYLGAALARLRRFDEAISACQDGVAICRETGDRHREGGTLTAFGDVLRRARQFDEAITAHQDAAAAFRETGNRHSEGIALNNISLALQQVRRVDEAITASQEASAIFRETGDRSREGPTLANLGGTLVLARRPDEGVTLLQDAIVICRETGDLQFEGVALTNLSRGLHVLRRYDEAITASQSAITIYHETGNLEGEALARYYLGVTSEDARRFGEAITAYREAIAIYRKTGDRHSAAAPLSDLARTLSTMRRAAEAITAYQEAIAIYRETGDRRREGRVLVALGGALYMARRFAEAITAYEDAVASFRETGDADLERAAADILEGVRSTERVWQRRWLRGLIRIVIWAVASWQRVWPNAGKPPASWSASAPD